MNPPDGLLRFGRLGSAHGLDGTIKLFLQADPSNIVQLQRVWLEQLGWTDVRRLELKAIPALIALVGVQTRDRAETLRNADLYCQRDALRPQEGQFLYADLLGARVQNPNGELLGVVTEVLDNGPQDLLKVQVGEKSFLVPFQADYVRVLQNPNVVVEIDPIPGLLE